MRKRELVIDGTRICDESPCFVIAEIGHNHQGNLETAKELFKAARDCGAHAVKMQKRTNRALFTKAAYDRPYDNENSFGATYGEHREALEFGWDEYRELIRYSKEIGITFFSTAFDHQAADFLRELDMPAYKIASGDLTNVPLLRYVASFQRPMIISTGGHSMDDIQRAYDLMKPINPQLAILQCTSGYPCVFEEMNLRVIQTLRDAFPDTVIGLSAHDHGISIPVSGYVLGARIIEKHFTLNRAMKGTDHAFSLERPGLQRLVRDLERTRVALGDGVKRVYESEKAPITKLGKKLVAARDLPAGHVLTAADIAIKSPADGLPAFEFDRLVGMTLRVPVTEDENFTFELVG